MAKISFSNQRLLDRLFVQSGYVLDFSNATFADFFESEVGIDIYDPRYETNGTSKGNRFRTFLKTGDEPTVARALRALWEYRRDTIGSSSDDPDLEPRIMKLIHELSPTDVSQLAAASPVAVALPRTEAIVSAGDPALATTALASYAHQDTLYNQRVLGQVNRLRRDGVDCWSDHFETFPREGWPRWMTTQLAERRWILVFASEAYKRRADGNEEPGRGLGVIWEHGIIRSELYEKGKINERFLPVGFGPSGRDHVPGDLRDYTYFDLDSEEDYRKLLSVLREKPFVTPHPIGGIPTIGAQPALAVPADSVAQDVTESLKDDDGKPLKSQSSTAFFSERFAQAFPGVRGISWFKQHEAVARLALLLKRPLTYRTRDGGEYEPIWFWGRGDLGIDHFSVQHETLVLLDVSEMIIDEVAAVNLGGYSHKFVYVKTSPAEPTGLYEHDDIEGLISTFGYVSEDYGLYRGRFVTRAEYDDGAAVIDGSPVDIRSSVELRVRFLTPYNIIIAAHNSPINSHQFDRIGTELLNGVLRGDKTIEELAAAVLRLPKRPPMSYEFG